MCHPHVYVSGGHIFTFTHPHIATCGATRMLKSMVTMLKKALTKRNWGLRIPVCVRLPGYVHAVFCVLAYRPFSIEQMLITSKMPTHCLHTTGSCIYKHPGIWHRESICRLTLNCKMYNDHTHTGGSSRLNNLQYNSKEIKTEHDHSNHLVKCGKMLKQQLNQVDWISLDNTKTYFSFVFCQFKVAPL